MLLWRGYLSFGKKKQYKNNMDEGGLICKKRSRYRAEAALIDFIKRLLLRGNTHPSEEELLAVWNKYAGQKNVLYIHARLGTSNWSNTTWEDFRKSSWFLDGCDDASDRSYCDIYAKIDPESI